MFLLPELPSLFNIILFVITIASAHVWAGYTQKEK
jgi:hypothetical protein